MVAKGELRSLLRRVSLLTLARRNYLLAKANVDAPALASSIAGLNTSNTFQPLNPLHDTDVAGFLRHTHEQTIISAIEESRRQAELDFYENINHRIMKDWEAR